MMNSQVKVDYGPAQGFKTFKECKDVGFVRAFKLSSLKTLPKTHLLQIIFEGQSTAEQLYCPL